MSKPSKEVSCDLDVKKVASQFLSHKKCNSKKESKYATKVTGKFLNDYLHQKQVFASVIKEGCITNPFNSRKKYFICCNLKRSIDYNMKKMPVATAIVSTIPELGLENVTPSAPSNVPSEKPSITNILTRSERAFMRGRIPATSLKGIKSINLKISGDEDVVVDTSKLSTTKGYSYSKMYEQDIIKLSNKKYKVPFGKLTMRQKKMRSFDLSKSVLSACIDRKQYKEFGADYLENNKELGVDCLNLLDSLKNSIEKKMKMSFQDLQDAPIESVPNDPQGLITTLDEKKDSHKLAIAILCSSSRRGYNRLRYNMDTFVSIPTYKELVKDRPPISGFDLKVNVSSTQTPATPQALTEDQELEVMLRQTSHSGDTFHAARIDGGYGTYLDLMEVNHSYCGRMIDNNSQVIVIDSIDGAEHTRSNKKTSSIISFSSTLMDPKWINQKSITAGSSLNILTWQQVKGVENYEIMMKSTAEYYEQKKIIREVACDSGNRGNYSFYDLHDGKMLYLLTQHSAWNRKHHPFLLCDCARGEGVINNDHHQCRIISESNQIELYETSAKKFLKYKARAEQKGREYTKKDHMDWVDAKNKGVSHYGINPSLLPRHTLRFDTFHLKCSITRRLMSYLRIFILNQAPNIIEGFDKVLKSFWNDYHLFIWRNRKNFSSFLGNELALFTGNVSAITKYLTDNLILTRDLNDVVTGLSLWVKLFKFLGFTHLTISKSQYLREIEIFTMNVKNFYSAGARTYLSSPAHNGDEETFYMHTLRYYIPRIALETYESHKCGIGIFNMQGFERRNKESKNCLKRFSNNSGNVVINNMARIYDVFKHKVNAV